MAQDDFGPVIKQTRAATARVLPAYLRIANMIRQPCFLNGNTPRNECRSLGQAYQLLEMNATSRDTRSAERNWRKESSKVHPDKLSGANYDAIARATADYTLYVLNTARNVVLSGHDIPQQQGCMADAKKLPLTAQGLAKFTTDWVGKADEDTRKNAAPNIRSQRIAWRTLNLRERTAVAADSLSPSAEVPSARLVLAAANGQAKAHVNPARSAAAAAEAATNQRTQNAEAETAARTQQRTTEQEAEAAAEAEAAQRASEESARHTEDQAAAEQEAQATREAHEAAAAAAQAQAAKDAANREKELLKKERAKPTKPQPSPPTGANDQTAIDHITVEDCYIGGVRHIDDVPLEFAQDWAHAYSVVLKEANKQIEFPTNEEEQTRAIKWQMALHHILFRQVNRGTPDSRQFNCAIKQRFQLWNDGNYAALIQGWEKDAQRTTNPPKVRTGQELKTYNNIQAVNLAKQGQVRRAANKANETQAKANMQAPEVQTQAKAKHPQRKEANYWDPNIIQGEKPELLIDCTAKLKKLDLLAASGPSGMSNKFLSALSSRVWPSGSEAEQAVPRLNHFANLYMNAKLPAWYMQLMLSVRQIGLDKGKNWTDGNTDYRFIGIGENLRRLFWNVAFNSHGKCFQNFFEPQQLAMGTPAGGQILALGTAILMEKYPRHVFIQDDLENMFGTAIRMEGVKNILANSDCSPWHKIIDYENYPMANSYIQNGQGKLTRAPWDYEEGGQQGATVSSLTACAAIQPYLKQLDETLRPHGGSARKGIDDGVTHAPPEVLWPAIEKFYKDIQEHCGLKVNRSKTKVYSPNGNYIGKPQEFAIGSVSAIMPNHLNGEPTEITAEGLTIWGVATSQDDDFIRANLAAKTKEVCSNINNITNSLNSLSPDVAFTVLRLSLQPRLQFHQQTHRFDLLCEANKDVQICLDNAVNQIFSFDPRSPDSYSMDPNTSLTQESWSNSSRFLQDSRALD